MDYKDYLKRKKLSKNTKEAYLSDIRAFELYLDNKGIDDTDKSDIIKYIISLREENYSESSIARKVAALKSYFYYAINLGLISRDPTFEIESPKVSRNRDIKTLSEAEINVLMEKPTLLYGNKLKGLRDTLLFELLYRTGINITELLNKKIEDINTDIGYINYNDKYLKLDIEIIEIAVSYINIISKKYPKNIFLFINLNGQQLTRQGVWKIFNYYSKKLEFDDNISPQTLLNTHNIKFRR